MELVKAIPPDQYEIEIIHPTKVNAQSRGWFRHGDKDHKHVNVIHQKNPSNGINQHATQAASGEFLEGNDEDYLVIDFLEDERVASAHGPAHGPESYVDINLKSSRQLVVYLARKPRLLVRCRLRAVTHVPVLERNASSQYVMFLRPFYRLTISKTEFWYYDYCHTVFRQPIRRSVRRKPFHYTEKVESRDEEPMYSPNTSTGKDLSGYQLTFVNESTQEVSKLTLSADFTLSYEEKGGRLKDISTDIDITDSDAAAPGVLKRSYSIEFLNEDQPSFSAENVSSRMEQGEGQEVFNDSDYESEVSFNSSREGHHHPGDRSTLKRSYSIEFLTEKEDEECPFSAEMVSYQINNGEGSLIYSDVEHRPDQTTSIESSTISEQPTNLKRSYNIEVLDETEDKRSRHSYETISSKIEKGESRLVYADPDTSIPVQRQRSVKKSPSLKLKTLDVTMNIEDDDENVPLSNEKRAYSIEFMHEIDDQIVPSFSSGVEGEREPVEDEIVACEALADQQEPGFDFYEQDNSLGLQPKIVNIDIDLNANDDPTLEQKAYNIEFLDEKPMSLALEGNQTSTPLKRGGSLHSPRKSPLQTISINLEFDKRNTADQDEDEMCINDADDYLVCEEPRSGRGRIKSDGSQNEWAALKLRTVNVDMETHHKRRRSSLMEDRDYQLEFQTEQERRMSMMAMNGRRSPGSTTPLKTISVETDSEEISFDNEFNEAEPSASLLKKKKWYSVELLSEADGDRSVFTEEIHDGTGTWTLDV